jgi:hypothetical protein
MSATPLVRQPLATALAAALMALGITGAAWASSSANAGVESPRGTGTSQSR